MLLEIWIPSHLQRAGLQQLIHIWVISYALMDDLSTSTDKFSLQVMIPAADALGKSFHVLAVSA